MAELGITPDEISYNAAISACEKSAQWQVALRLLSVAMPQMRVAPSEVSYNAAISACEKGGQWQMAIGLLHDMSEMQLSPDQITFSAVMSACEKGSQWQLALAILSRMPEMRALPNQISYSAVISACEKVGQWQPALGLLRQMSETKVVPDSINYNAAISSCEKGGQWQLALGLLGQMSETKTTPSKITYNAAISACEKGGQWQFALSLLSQMSHGRAVPNEISYSAAISACGKGAQWQLALGLLGQMPEMSLTPNRISYSAAISACEKCGQWQIALGLLSSMPDIKVMPDAISYNAAISSCEKAGRWQLALSLLGQMPAQHLAPGTGSYSAAISVCKKGGQWQLALSLLDQMTLQRLTPDVISCNSAISVCSEAGQWQEALWLGRGIMVTFGSNLGISFGTLVMESEQRDLLAVELSLTARLSEAARQGELFPGAAVVLDSSAGFRNTPSAEQDPARSKSLLDSVILAVTSSSVKRAPDQHLLRSMSLPYQREMALLRHVFASAQPGSAAATAEAIDDFGRELGEAGSWAKFAGGSKAAALLAAMSGGPPTVRSDEVAQPGKSVRGTRGSVLEIGTYIGNSALRLAATLPGVHVTTLELDPVLVAIARSLIAFAGLAACVDVWTGHSKLLIPRLSKVVASGHSSVRPCLNAIFMDRWGSQYDEDLALIQQHGLLQESGGVLVADNVLSTAAASFLWQVARPCEHTIGRGESYQADRAKDGGHQNLNSVPFVSQMMAVQEVADTSDEDWMSVSVSLTRRGTNCIADVELPSELAELQAASERLRERVVTTGGREVARSEMPAFLIRTKAVLTQFGIFPSG
ncbi:unnamed protein product [Polarella glacialis]|uniref:PROP1-like PPR domain-containing protein n=1 Tax=Polarella glacialis TaxID=89957 RepID=A0A813FLB9_POLGL|nr:unnamed protein product [Polarella glacialis]